MKKFLVLAASAALFVACNSKPGYKITGTVDNPDLNGQYVYLFEYDDLDESPQDSALVENGTFILEGQQDEPELYVLTFSEDVIPSDSAAPGENGIYTAVFVLENADLMATLDSTSTVSGTPENDALKAYHEKIKKLNKESAPMLDKVKNMKNLDESEKDKVKKWYDEYIVKKTELAKEYVENHLHKLTGGFIFGRFAQFMGEDVQSNTLDKADSTFKSAPGVDKASKRLDVLKKVAVGQKFTDFTAKTPDGKTQKLSDYAGKGKYVLVDFWASWCPPCRKDMPNIAKAYKEYKDKGLEIVGVSLDEDSAKWNEAITEMTMVWPQLSDGEGWEGEAVTLYGVEKIPQTILINPEGIIIEKNLKGDKLDKKLKEVLK